MQDNTAKLKEQIEFYLEDYGFDAEVKPKKYDDGYVGEYFDVILKRHNHTAEYKMECRTENGGDFEIWLYEDTYTRLSEANLWKWLYITEFSKNPER